MHEQILVRVRAASLNYRDQGVIKGSYGYTKFPVIPMCDGAGEVVALGPGVTQFKVGDRIASTFFQTWTGGRIPPDASKNSLGGQLDGVLAEYIALSQNGAIRIPDHLSLKKRRRCPVPPDGLNALTKLAASSPGRNRRDPRAPAAYRVRA